MTQVIVYVARTFRRLKTTFHSEVNVHISHIFMALAIAVFVERKERERELGG